MDNCRCDELRAVFDDGDELRAVFEDADELDAEFETVIEKTVGDIYEGPYEAVPAADAQEIPTAGKIMARDFVIRPIPSNYGLITWNGATLTVS